MKNNWQTKKLGELLVIERGGSPRPIDKYLTDDPNGINWIKIGDAQLGSKYIYSTKEKIKREGLTKTRQVEEGDFLLSNSMSFGRPYILKTNGAIHDGWLVLRNTNQIINRDYLFYFLSSDAIFHQFDNLAAGSTVRNLNTQLVKGVSISYPPLEEQKRIVKILDEAFEKIEKAKQNAGKNLRNSREIFESYLNHEFIKNDWSTKKLIEISDFQNGYAFKSPLFHSTGLPILRISNIQRGIIDTSDLVYFNENDYKENFEKYKVLSGDLVIAMSGATTGKLGINNTDITFYLNQRVGKFIPKKDLLKDYLYYFLYTKVEDNLKISSGAAQPNLSTEQIKNIDIPLPSPEEQKRIVKKLDALSQQTKNLGTIYNQKLIDLEELKKSILQKAFSGEL